MGNSVLLPRFERGTFSSGGQRRPRYVIFAPSNIVGRVGGRLDTESVRNPERCLDFGPFRALS
jgi:hypothetical protein